MFVVYCIGWCVTSRKNINFSSFPRIQLDPKCSKFPVCRGYWVPPEYGEQSRIIADHLRGSSMQDGTLRNYRINLWCHIMDNGQSLPNCFGLLVFTSKWFIQYMFNGSLYCLCKQTTLTSCWASCSTVCCRTPSTTSSCTLTLWFHRLSAPTSSVQQRQILPTSSLASTASPSLSSSWSVLS